MNNSLDLTARYVSYLFSLRVANFTSRSSFSGSSRHLSASDDHPLLSDDDDDVHPLTMGFIDLSAVDDDEPVSAINSNISETSSSSSAEASMFNFSSVEAGNIIEEFLANMQTIRQPATIALVCLYVPVFVFSLTGNSFVIALFIKDRRMRRSKSLFLVNLALTDEAVTLVCIPLVVSQTVNRLWIYGDLLCKLTGFMQGKLIYCYCRIPA